MTTKYIKTITFDEIINQTLEQKEEIAKAFRNMIENYKREYSYYTLIVDFRTERNSNHHYLHFIVDTETENGYITGFNLKLMTLCIDNYSEDELTKNLIVELLEKELAKLKRMTN